ncbi:MAG TPA: hypothetical protein DFR83_11965, partial [Deltaproteobacteria bacterium]|nr:hypothetical protein [Deltaproteobacteria bacterium]
DGIDNDCDGSTSEAGAARFIATDGAISHVTEALTGTSSVPVDYTLSTDGTLQMCEGTWYVRLEVQANVAIHGTGADRVMLSSSAAGTVIDIAGSDRDVEIQGLTVTDGVADGMSPMLDTYAGGGINCYDASGSSSLTLDNVELHANDAIVGGGLSLFGCDATVTNSTIAHNAAWFGGGIYASWSGLTLDGVVVSENEAWTNGGGVLTDGTTGSTTLSLVQSSVRDNVADRGGGLYLSSVESSSCVGATDSTAGILSNRASVAGGGVYFAQGEVFASDTCDFGVLALGTDNHPEDVHISVDSVYADYGDDASFTCDRNTCE